MGTDSFDSPKALICTNQPNIIDPLFRSSLLMLRSDFHLLNPQTTLQNRFKGSLLGEEGGVMINPNKLLKAITGP